MSDEPFEQHRAHLRAVAYRMLGSTAEADDAVQEAWLRFARADAAAVEDLRAWLTTVVARVCLDLLRQRTARREDHMEGIEPVAAAHPDDDRALAESVGLALLVVLEKLEPAERIAFVLHDTVGMPFDAISEIVGRTPVATRQLASRARRRVQGAPPADEAALGPQRAIVEAFLAALRAGDYAGLVAVLDPDVVVRGMGREVRGADAWAKGAASWTQLAADVEPALVDGAPGVIFAPRGTVVRALRFTLAADRIAEVEIFADPSGLSIDAL